MSSQPANKSPLMTVTVSRLMHAKLSHINDRTGVPIRRLVEDALTECMRRKHGRTLADFRDPSEGEPEFVAADAVGGGGADDESVRPPDSS